MTLDDLLKTRYRKYGRGPDEHDCWGLVRVARAEIFGRDWLPSYAEIDPQDKSGLTQAALTVRRRGHFAEVGIQPGAIATAWRASLCVHVGIVVEADGRLWVLETDEGTGPMMIRPSVFEGRYTKVIYYDN